MAMQMALIGILASKSHGFTIDHSPLKPNTLLTEPGLHPECEKTLTSREKDPRAVSKIDLNSDIDRDLDRNLDSERKEDNASVPYQDSDHPEIYVERSMFTCRGLSVFNSFEIFSPSLDVRLSRFPSEADSLLASDPSQDGWILDQDKIVPVTQVKNLKTISYINLLTNQIVYEQNLSFDAAQVYLSNSRDRELSTVDLPLSSSKFLESNLYSVVSEASERLLFSPEMNFSPDQEPNFFDQVQVYYHLGRITGWFSGHGSTPNDKVEVRIHLQGDAEINNGAYLPEAGPGPLIKIGQGDSFVMAHLARDLDVIAHEYSHHVIFQTLKTSKGESGILHEGYADYFAFAMGEDPNLAETIMVSGLPLRSADLPRDFKYNREGKDWSKHRKSQFFSRLLWLLRDFYGKSFDQTVIQSLGFLKPDASLHDGLHALLLATNSEEQRCKAIETALNLGFDEALIGLDGSRCGVDLGVLPQDKKYSRQRSLIDRKAFGCSTIDGVGGSSILGSWLFLVPFLALFRFKIMKGLKAASRFRDLMGLRVKNRSHRQIRWLHKGRQYDHET
jgi:hypothetical protein